METESSLPHSQDPVTCLCSEPDKFSPCPNFTSWRSILILFSHLLLGLQSGLLPLGFPTKTLHASLLFLIHATHTFRLILLTFDDSNDIWWLSPCWKTYSTSASQEISRILWSPSVHYRIHKSPQLFRIFSQMNEISLPSLISPVPNSLLNYKMLHYFCVAAAAVVLLLSLSLSLLWEYV